MDHIVQLPKAGKEQYDAILVIVDRLTKQAIYIPCHTTDTAKDFARLFLENVFSKHGLPADIVSDRGSLFLSQFWKELCKILGIQSRLSTAYHPQTDGQTERTNQSLEGYLRIYTSYDQDDWDSLLPIAEFVYNNTPHSATGLTPFFANKGYHPKLSINLSKVNDSEANQYATELRELHKYLKQRIYEANKAAANQFNCHRAGNPVRKKGDQVWLDMGNIRTRRPTKKLDHKWTGPYTILDKIGLHAYQLELPGDLQRIHNVFHVDRLKPHHPDPFQRVVSPPPPIYIKGEPEYEVESIKDSHPTGEADRGIQYLIKWKGYDEESWIPWKGMAGSIDLIREWEKNHPRKRKLPLELLKELESLAVQDEEERELRHAVESVG